MMRLRLAILAAFLACAAQARAATLYVSTTGSHDTNAPAFSTWATAATNIQSAIDAASAGDTVRVAPGTYNEAVTINKNLLTVQGGNGTLWDADRTIIDRLFFDRSTNSTAAGLTATKADGYYLFHTTSSAAGSRINSCIMHGGTRAKAIYTATAATVKNSIIVGSSLKQEAVDGGGVSTFLNCIIEANTPFQTYRVNVGNSVHGNTRGFNSIGGNITSNTTNSVMQALGIAPASEGVGTSLVWRGVSAYIPRLGSLARKNGQPYAGIETASDGAGGPALATIRPFIGRDVSTNRNHGAAVGGVTSAEDSPFAGERSAAFDGTSGYVGASALSAPETNRTLEAWIYIKTTNKFMAILGSGYDHIKSPFAFYVRPNSSTNGFAARFNFDGKDRSVIFGDSRTTNMWIHVAAVSSGTNLSGYVNGQLFSAPQLAVASAAVAENLYVRIGYQSALTAVTNFDGSISDVRIWNVARTPEQIAAAYTNRLTGAEEGLVGYWPFNGPVINPVDSGPFNLDNPTIHPTYLEAF